MKSEKFLIPETGKNVYGFRISDLAKVCGVTDVAIIKMSLDERRELIERYKKEGEK